MFLSSAWTLLPVIFILTLLPVSLQEDVGKLPFCSENHLNGLILVSTIDGRLSAVSSEGTLQWQVETGPVPLLTSNIHKLELTNNGNWIRIIPSLTGSLYRFDGRTIDPIPISAESLLKSSFKYSDDLVIAGGLEVHTYGIGFRTGTIFYNCTSLKCTNNTNNNNEVDDILLLERSTQTVRAVESYSGNERWNFSVGHHNIKLPQVSCVNQNSKLFNWNITAIVPDGLLLASNYEDNVKTTWQYHFPSPIVRVWKWNGLELSEIDLFAAKSDDKETGNQLSPAIYLGMHKKQLYIYESFKWQRKTRSYNAVAESSSLAKIPWKPISASGLITEDDSTALSILYSSEYVNGRGYFLFPEQCENNNTLKIPDIADGSNSSPNFVWTWWKEMLVILATSFFVIHLWYRSTRLQQKEKVIFVERHIEVPRSRTSSERLSESSESGSFHSRYLNDFDTLRCLGKGGFGVVFEVKQKIDECHYAIKRITLPNEESKRDAVMREVKALAKLEHKNIVRYFNSWVEKPPHGWQQEYDNVWIKDTSEFLSEGYTSQNDTISRNNNELSDVVIGLDPDSDLSLTRELNKIKTREESNDDDSFIVFDNNSNSKNTTWEIPRDESNNTDIVSCDVSHTSSGVNWRRPGRRCHSINDITSPATPPVFLYIQMQLCQKQSLKEWLSENKERSFPDILHIFKQIVSAVEYVHMRGLIHRDLKPSNIFFSLEGQIKVGDFGLVKDEEEAYDSQHSSSPARGHTKEVGTRLYMSPEQLEGRKYNYKVDIYSLGLIFFELLVYFSTDMERIRTLIDVRDNRFPKDFVEKYLDEYNLLKLMLCQMPEKRLTTIGVRARAPLSCCDSNYDQAYDFELPKPSKATI